MNPTQSYYEPVLEMSKTRVSKVELILLRSLVVKDRLCRTQFQGQVDTLALGSGIASAHTIRVCACVCVCVCVRPQRSLRGGFEMHPHPCTSEPLPPVALHPWVTSRPWLMITRMFMQPWGGLTAEQGSQAGLGAPGQLQPVLGISSSQGRQLQSGAAQPLPC